MPTLLLYISVSVIVGALHLMAGVFVGIWYVNKNRVKEEPSNSEDLIALMAQLSQITNNFSGDFSTHQKMLSDVSAKAKNLQNSSGSSEIKEILSQMQDANQQLNRRLEEVQGELDQKAKEVNDLMSESRTDALTQLPNRRSFDEELGRRLSEITRYGGDVSFVILDVDHFKSFNDTHGHLVGDQVLKSVAKTLQKTIRDSDVPARIGGEEFGVLMTSTNLVEAAKGAERLRAAIEEATIDVDGKQLKVTASFGVTEIQYGEESEEVVERADKALYAAKSNGRNRVWMNDHGDLKSCFPEENDLHGISQEMKESCESLRSDLLKSLD